MTPNTCLNSAPSGHWSASVSLCPASQHSHPLSLTSDSGTHTRCKYYRSDTYLSLTVLSFCLSSFYYRSRAFVSTQSLLSVNHLKCSVLLPGTADHSKGLGLQTASKIIKKIANCSSTNTLTVLSENVLLLWPSFSSSVEVRLMVKSVWFGSWQHVIFHLQILFPRCPCFD